MRIQNNGGYATWCLQAIAQRTEPTAALQCNFFLPYKNVWWEQPNTQNNVVYATLCLQPNTQNDVVYIVFAGHGSPAKGGGGADPSRTRSSRPWPRGLYGQSRG